jgi:tungstate transport system ATP-binding protein
MYTLERLQKHYGQKPVLDISALHIQEGEILGLVGPNGSGKSTLLRHLAFLEEADSGTLTYQNFTASTLPLHVKREISILLPEPYLLKRTVKDNLLFGLKIRGDMDNVEHRLHEAIELVGLLPKKFLPRAWHELSSGETQRIALASRLILKPKMLLLDEPTNSLDFSGVPQFSEAILHANKEWGTTIVISSHDLLWLNDIATRKIELHFGRLMDYSTSNHISGKWHEEGDMLVFYFDETQCMALPKTERIGEKRGVAINPREISVGIEKPSEKELIILKGMIKEISHTTKSNEISLKLAVGNHMLECIEPFELFQKRLLYPSQNIYLWFSKESIKIP